jgi:serine/threonine-protein kinase RsbW
MFRHVIKEQLRVPAKIDYLGALRDFVSKVGHKHGFSERVINAFKLSIDEAATNIIKHAYRDWEGDITIRALVKKNSLTIILLDQGKFFDPRQVSDPDLKRYVDIGKKGGLGIFIMRRLLDSIDYRKTEEGNELRMVKYRDVARRRKIAVPSIPMSLKARYWLVANGIFTAVVTSLYFFSYSQEDDRIINRYIRAANLACSDFATLTAQTLSTLPQDELNIMANEGGERYAVVQAVKRPISSILMTKHKEIIYKAYLVDIKGMIIAPMEDSLFLKDFKMPDKAKQLQKDV